MDRVGFKRVLTHASVFLFTNVISFAKSGKKLSKTMTIKDRTGELKTMTFEVEGPLCVIACTSYDKVYANNANQCLLLSLDNSPEQDQRIMAYQKKLKAGLVNEDNILLTQEKLQHLQLTLNSAPSGLASFKIINPYAPFIELPKETLHPRRTLPLILNFIEVITFYHHYQREVLANEDTGEVYVETQPSDIKWAFDLLKDVLFVKSDELSTAARSFYQWLCEFTKEKEQAFYATTIREHIRIHPRTLNRHLKELTEYGFLKITGGNRHTTGYSYSLSGVENNSLTDSIQKQLDEVMKKIESAYSTRNKAKSQKQSPKAGQSKTKPK